MIHKIGNSLIPVAPGISLSLLMRSPLFDNSDGKTPGSFIFNQKMPATPALRKEFSQGHRTTLDGRATSERPYLFQEGSLRFTGTCLLQEANELEYEILYNVRNGDFAYEASGISLKDLDLGGDRLLPTPIQSVANNPVEYYYSESRPGYGLWSTEFTLPLTNIFVDYTNSISLMYSTYTVQESGTFNAKEFLDIDIPWGTVYLRIYKNGILFSEHLLSNGINTFIHSWDLNARDVIAYTLYCVSEYDSGADWRRLIFLIKAGYSIEVRIPDLLFIDVVSGNQETFDYAVFPIQNPNLFDNFPKDEFQIDNVNIQKVYNENFFVQNYWMDGHFPFVLSGMKETELIYAMNIFTPFVYIKYLLDKIASRLNYEIIDSPFSENAPYFNACLFNAFAENTYTNDVARMISVKPSFNLADHVPDVSVNTFLNSLGKILGRRLDIDTEHRTITFVSLKQVIQSTGSIPFPGIITESPNTIVKPEYNGFKIEFKAASDKFISERIKQVNSKHVFKGSVVHINQMPFTGNTVNDMYLVTAINEFYVWKYNPTIYQLGWVYHSQNFYLTRQSGAEPFLEISAVIAPVIDNRIPDNTVGAPANRTWRIPVTSQPGNFEGFPDMSAEYGLQLLIYKGLYPDSNNANYPMSVTSQNNTAGYMAFAHPNMCLDGPTPNTFTEELEVWLNWLVYNTKPVKLKAIMTPGQLSAIRYAKKFRILGNNYLIEEIRVNMVDDHLSEAEIKAYTC